MNLLMEDDELSIWQDREIRFDITFEELKLINGEFEIDSINSVEDTKGNNGEKGSLRVTNLRLIWVSHKNIKINLSIGHNCICEFFFLLSYIHPL